MESAATTISAYLCALVDKNSNDRDPYIRTVTLDGHEAKNASIWLTFKDDSGSVRRFFRREGIYVPLVSEVSSFVVSCATFGFGHNFSTHWKTHYVYVFNNEDKCVSGLAMSSACKDYELDGWLREVEEQVTRYEKEEEDESYN